ncbi:MAG TPA: hypothetical protein VFF30_06325 [Nitrososphaerales archaeon]|nr:hypothetical protein [Nitrososphaerales archaeon]
MSKSKSVNRSNSEENAVAEEEKKENFTIVRDFFLMVLGIIFGYFASYSISSPGVVGIGVLINSATFAVIHFPVFPTLSEIDILARAIGFLFLVPISVMLYPLIYTRYLRWLRQQSSISLVRELTRCFFLLFWPLAPIWAISPQLSLDPVDQAIQRALGLIYVVFNLGFFFYKTRSARRGFLR